ncbi:MAG: radical SAM family heme chaperone HemW [Bacteroidia bacterium]|nr:radical SAM family heme chaperone HemW [Bacteroidia bacterium]MDW8015114.1 radical SAM family heme chaperone HemW [Bacteroidia bacterium]
MLPDWLEEAADALCSDIGLYIHIPFCRRACHYCDFYFTPRSSLMEAYVEALLKEMQLYHPLLEKVRIRTLFFGGGTPSWLPLNLYQKIFDHLMKFQTFSPIEITIEANPEDITPENLRAWKALGITRVSLGIQSFSEQVLQMLGRFHRPSSATQALLYLSEANFPSWSADLIFGVPGQTLEEFLKDLDHLLIYLPPHLSLYGLTIEERTVLYKKHKQGRLPPMDEDLYISMYLAAHELLHQKGYKWYEISNWAQEGHECQHNWRYWRRLSYIGLGPSAHSYIPEQRWANRRSLKDYLNLVTRGILPLTFHERLSPLEIREELWLTTLRTRQGLPLSSIKALFGPNFHQLTPLLSEMIERRWITVRDDTLHLSPTGALMFDFITLKLESKG